MEIDPCRELPAPPPTIALEEFVQQEGGEVVVVEDVNSCGASMVLKEVVECPEEASLPCGPVIDCPVEQKGPMFLRGSFLQRMANWLSR